MISLKACLLITGSTLVMFGYRLLAVPPDTISEIMLARAKQGMLCVILGGTCLMLWLAKR